ncbi:Kunitz/Bovine pancreatic trypsin inhibitor domain protein [Teladorsagia circumcincta]|uniref:Kunitz/Bovine pancreatic trypsin inhibitor domain protein n=1 Tax=Teladorsagia circumcincta TaxID=45464 RepID=A0A2G9V3N7_TELCI|nr:Kunitz/Bovine pancreatic trypsin inhibitor domain protein [Teladorsagia circumcincta]
MPIDPTDICEMGPPNGRFCGFKVMYTYNKETLQCDEFWFPGCTTEETNANLFSDLRSCRKLADLCKGWGVFPYSSLHWCLPIQGSFEVRPAHRKLF